jgi:hypothetical protein
LFGLCRILVRLNPRVWMIFKGWLVLSRLSVFSCLLLVRFIGNVIRICIQGQYCATVYMDPLIFGDFFVDK